MRENKKIILILFIVLSVILIGANSYAHSGRTDSSGGHKDNKNKSGLGSYHYHCGGHPAHLHTNGVCPYSSSSSSSKSNKSSSSSSSKKSTSSSSSKSSSSTSSSSSSKKTTTVPATISATAIQINENINNIEVGESKKITATITPDNATDKNIIWKSSDESIATISASGEVIAKKPGTIDITASTSNGKTSTIKINVKEEPKDKNNVITNTTPTTKSNINNNTTTNNQEDTNPLGGVIALGLLGGGGYWGYKKYKKTK